HEWPVLSGGDWRRYLTGIADGLYALAVQHPGLAMFSAMALAPSAASSRLYNAAAVELTTLGWSVRLATHAVSLTMRAVLDGRRFADGRENEQESRSIAGATLHRELSPTPVFAESMEPGSPEWYQYELQIVLAGVEQMARQEDGDLDLVET